MPAGATIYNDFDTIQIDENWPNICVVAMGNGTFNADGEATITLSSPSAPIIALTGSGVGPAFWPGSGTQASVIGTPNTSFTWYQLDKPQPPYPTFGFEVRNAQGDVCFHSAFKYARFVINHITDSWTGAIALPANRTHAVIWMVEAASQEIQEEEVRAGWWRWRKRNIGPVAVFSNGQVGWSGYTGKWGDWTPEVDIYSPPALGPTRGTLHATIIDVTGY